MQRCLVAQSLLMTAAQQQREEGTTPEKAKDGRLEKRENIHDKTRGRVQGEGHARRRVVLDCFFRFCHSPLLLPPLLASGALFLVFALGRGRRRRGFQVEGQDTELRDLSKPSG